MVAKIVCELIWLCSWATGFKRLMVSDKDWEPGSLSISRKNVLSLIDSYINQMLAIKRFLLLVFISGVILAPISITLSIYILIHPSFDEVLDSQDNFGEIIEGLLTAVFIGSSLWFVVSIKHYLSIGAWNKTYKQYLLEHAEMERRISSYVPRLQTSSETNPIRRLSKQF
jgi:hypothetical protein